MPVLRYQADPRSPPLPGREICDGLTGQDDLTSGSSCETDDRVDQGPLTVAFDTGNTDDLTLVDLEADPIEQRAPIGGKQPKVGHLQQHLILDGRLPRFGRGKLRSDHHLGKLAEHRPLSGWWCPRCGRRASL